MIPFIGSSRTDKSMLRNQNSGCVVPWQGVRGGRVQGIEEHGIFRDFPDGPVVKDSALEYREYGFDPWSGS